MNMGNTAIWEWEGFFPYPPVYFFWKNILDVIKKKKDKQPNNVKSFITTEWNDLVALTKNSVKTSLTQHPIIEMFSFEMKPIFHL